MLNDYKVPESSDDNTLTGGSLSPELTSDYGVLKSPYDDLYSMEYNQLNGIPGGTSSVNRFSSGDFNSQDINCNIKVRGNANSLKAYVSIGKQKNKQTTPVNDKTDCESPTEDKGVCGRCEQNRPKTKDLENTCNCDDGLNSLDAKRKDSVEMEDANDTILKEGPNKHNDDKKRTFADVFSDTESDSSSSR